MQRNKKKRVEKEMEKDNSGKSCAVFQFIYNDVFTEKVFPDNSSALCQVARVMT